jgi:CheY-like chemotaxis protein
MRFPIDVVFLDANYKIIKLIERLDPWRTAASRKSKAVLELAAGETARRGLSVDDRLAVVEQPSDRAGTVPGTRVLLVSSDRRFRFAASTLLTQRGYSVTLSPDAANLSEIALHARAEVVVIDTGSSLTGTAHDAARLRSLRPAVGLVAVSAEPHTGLSTLPVLPKWSSCESLSAAIEQARPGAGDNVAR